MRNPAAVLGIALGLATATWAVVGPSGGAVPSPEEARTPDAPVARPRLAVANRFAVPVESPRPIPDPWTDDEKPREPPPTDWLCAGTAGKILDALDWLKRDAEHAADTERIALATLACLAAGYTNRGDHSYAKTVGHGLRRLKNVQDAQGAFDDDPRTHALATLALVDAYGMTRSAIYKGPATKGMHWLLSSAPWRRAADPSTGAWAWLALDASRRIAAADGAMGRPAWFEPPVDAFEQALVWASRAGASGRGIAEAVEALARLDRPADDRLRSQAVARVAARPPVPGDEDLGNPWDDDLERQVFASTALFEARHEPWVVRGSDAYRDGLLERQRTGGLDVPERGSWDPRDGRCRTTTTALAVLALLADHRCTRPSPRLHVLAGRGPEGDDPSRPPADRYRVRNAIAPMR